jgi:hypothetical protein
MDDARPTPQRDADGETRRRVRIVWPRHQRGPRVWMADRPAMSEEWPADGE